MKNNLCIGAQVAIRSIGLLLTLALAVIGCAVDIGSQQQGLSTTNSCPYDPFKCDPKSPQADNNCKLACGGDGAGAYCQEISCVADQWGACHPFCGGLCYPNYPRLLKVGVCQTGYGPE